MNLRVASLLLIACSLKIVLCKGSVADFARDEIIEDNEFADFEEFDDGVVDRDEVVPSSTVAPSEAAEDSSKEGGAKPGSPESKYEFGDEDDETTVEEEEGDEFEHFQDAEEFEGFDGASSTKAKSSKSPTGSAAPEIKIAKVPFVHSRWDSYSLEILFLLGVAIYVANFLVGRGKNAKIARMWFDAHRPILEENFALVGDDGKKDTSPSSGGKVLMKESEHVYTLWCSGRTCCEGMLVELKLLKRQDLVNMVAQLFRRSGDLVEITVRMGFDDMDNFVTFAGQKRAGSAALKMAKEMNDLVTFGGEKRAGDKYGLPSNFFVLSEIGEATAAVLDSRTQALVKRHPDLVEYIHVSDRYSGPKNPDDAGGQVKLPDAKKVIKVGVNFPPKAKGHVEAEEVEAMKPVLLLVFYLMEKLKRFRLSKESKQKAEKNRAKVEESFLKTTHQARAEAAAQRREERRRLEKEKIMAEEDPEKQRRWEEKETRRQMKKRQPRIKQLKVKAM